MIRRRGNSLEVRVYAGTVADGKERHLYATIRGTGRKAQREAKHKEAALLAQAAGGRVPAGVVTFDQLADDWIAVARHEKSTRYQTERYLDRHVRPVFGKRRIERIGPADLNRLYLALEEGSSDRRPLNASTVVRIHGIIHACFELAVRNGWVSANPAARARPPKQLQKVPEAPDVESVRALLTSSYQTNKEMHAFIRVAAATGLRRGSICGLRWSDVDLVRGALLHQRAIGLGKGSPYEKATKSGVSHTIALDRDTIMILRWHRLRMHVRSKDFGGLDRHGFVFSADPTCSKPWRPDHPTKLFRRIADAAGVKVDLRALRNFHATELLNEGFDLKTVSGRLTHSRTSTTQDRYQARVPATDRRAAEHVASKLRRR